jgi:FkbM family methyltransferase
MFAEKLRDFVGCAMKLGAGPADRWRILWRQTKNLRARFGLSRYHPTSLFSLQTVYGRLWFRDNFGDITNLPGLLYHEVYAPPRPLGQGAILDVGANIGLAAAWFAHRFPGHAIHCFEPLTANARLIALNCPGATVNETAVGSAPGTIDLQVDADSVMATSIDTRWATSARQVPVVRLDDYAMARGVDRVAMLKIDTEGMELDVLGGAAATLARTELVAMETHGASRHRGSIALLRGAGFQVDREEFSGATGFVIASRPRPGSDRAVSATVP